MKKKNFSEAQIVSILRTQETGSIFISIQPMMVLNLLGAFKTTSTTTTRKYTTLQKKHQTTGTMNHSKKLPDENKFKPNLNLKP